MKRTLFAMLVFSSILITISPSLAEWSGVDETVVEKYAEEHGRGAREPYINTDSGDMLLFVFLLGGAVSGFMGGYYWRMLMERSANSGDDVAGKDSRKSSSG